MSNSAEMATLAIWILASLTASPATPTAERAVDIVGFDYAFKTPATLPPGPTVFRFVNTGKVAHELNIVQLKAGVTLRSFIAAGDSGKPVSPMIERVVGVLFAKPGQRASAALAVDLVAGATYAVQCVFRDSAKAPRHSAMGMFSAIEIAGTSAGASRPAATPPVRVDTIVAMDYAFKYPHTLAPGRHRFVFVNTGKQRHEVSLARLERGATYKQIAAIDAKGGDIDSLLDDGIGVLHSLAGTTPAGALDVVLLAGRDYLLECGFTDTDGAKPHFMLGMSGVIHVTR